MNCSENENYKELMQGIKASDEASTYVKDVISPLIRSIYNSFIQQGFSKEYSFILTRDYWTHLLLNISK